MIIPISNARPPSFLNFERLFDTSNKNKLTRLNRVYVVFLQSTGTRYTQCLPNFFPGLVVALNLIVFFLPRYNKIVPLELHVVVSVQNNVDICDLYLREMRTWTLRESAVILKHEENLKSYPNPWTPSVTVPGNIKSSNRLIPQTSNFSKAFAIKTLRVSVENWRDESNYGSMAIVSYLGRTVTIDHFHSTERRSGAR